MITSEDYQCDVKPNVYSGNETVNSVRVSVVCPRCGSSVAIEDSYADAVHLWNELQREVELRDLRNKMREIHRFVASLPKTMIWKTEAREMTEALESIHRPRKAVVRFRKLEE